MISISLRYIYSFEIKYFAYSYYRVNIKKIPCGDFCGLQKCCIFETLNEIKIIKFFIKLGDIFHKYNSYR